MRRSLACLFLAATLLSLLAHGQATSIVVVDPVSLSGASAALFSDGTATLALRLASQYPLPRAITARLAWSASEWTAFVQGLLRGMGYDARIVQHVDASGTWTSLVVAIPLGTSPAAFVPVAVALPSEGSGLGRIAWSQQGISFDSRYSSFSSVLPLAGNMPPSFSVIVPGEIVYGARREFLIAGANAGSELVAFVWTVNGVVVGADMRRTMTLSFPEAGEYVLQVTAFDKAGASTTVTDNVTVLREARACACG